MRRLASPFVALVPMLAVAACADPVTPEARAPLAVHAQADGAGVPLNWAVHLSGDAEVPARETRAQGQATFQLAPDGESMTFRLNVANIENVIQAHIHVGPAGANGPVAVFLYGLVPGGGGRTQGVLNTGVITSASLIGPLAGASLGDLVAVMRAGNAYVNVHTNRGVPGSPLAPGNFPGGEVRGQILHGSGMH